ncbi:hypothetical protein ACFO5K_21235 [Nocardia halotolerans]|uniref:Uncharacterized protein n=1 Tax=Nocardia halotolerans TaxID=1755878 RepID=A0ABV8VPQ5_9NOCA
MRAAGRRASTTRPATSLEGDETTEQRGGTVDGEGFGEFLW